MIVSQKAARVRKIILSPLTLKIVPIILGIVILISGFIIYDYVKYSKQVAEMQALRAEAQSQQKEIISFLEKITHLEKQLEKLRETEMQMERDLKEILGPKKSKEGLPYGPPKKTSRETKEVRK
jgi:uncharacterized membrane protein (DUF106 family)